MLSLRRTTRPCRGQKAACSKTSDDEIRQQARLNSLDTELQADPVLNDERASGTKVAMFAVAIGISPAGASGQPSRWTSTAGG